MAHWRDFEEASPDLAAKAQELLKHEGGNLYFAFLATQSSSGRLRLHPVCPVILDGLLYYVAEGKTPKKQDLLRNGRFALHTLIYPGRKNEQVYFAGRAVLANDAATRASVEATFPGWTFTDDEMVFELLIDRCLYTVWEEGAGYRRLKWIEGQSG